MKKKESGYRIRLVNKFKLVWSNHHSDYDKLHAYRKNLVEKYRSLVEQTSETKEPINELMHSIEINERKYFEVQYYEQLDIAEYFKQFGNVDFVA